MGAKVSAEMLTARKLVTEQGMSAYEAANVAGVSSSAIYMSDWYKKWKLKQQTRNCKLPR